MINYKSSIKLTTYSESQILDIYKQIKILGEKDKVNFQINLKKPYKAVTEQCHRVCNRFLPLLPHKMFRIVIKFC